MAIQETITVEVSRFVTYRETLAIKVPRDAVHDPTPPTPEENEAAFKKALAYVTASDAVAAPLKWEAEKWTETRTEAKADLHDPIPF